MAIDPYALCPCGSGKKLKFCCSDLIGDIEIIHRQIEGEQHQAALTHIEATLKKHPNRESLLDLKVITLCLLQDLDEARLAVESYIKLHPENPSAHAHLAILLANLGEAVEATAKLQDGIDLAQEDIPERLVTAISAVAESLLLKGLIPAARAHFLLHSQLSPKEDNASLELLIELNRYGKLPLLLRDNLRLLETAEGTPWEEDFDDALDLAYRAQWRAAALEFSKLNKEHPDQPEIIYNYAVTAGFMGDTETLVTQLYAYALLQEVSADDSLEAEALAQLLDDEIAPTTLDILKQTYPVLDQEKLVKTLESSKRFAGYPNDPSQYVKAGLPAPSHAFLVLDRSQPPTQDTYAETDIARVVGMLSLFGRQTDRAERMELTTDEGAFEIDSLAALKTLGPDLFGEKEEQEVISTKPVLDQALSIRWNFPSNLTPQQRYGLLFAEKQKVLAEIWPTIPLASLQEKTPAEVAGNPEFEHSLQAAILLLEQGSNNYALADTFVTLRDKLKLPQLTPIDAKTIDPSQFSLLRIGRLNLKDLDNLALVQLYRRSLMINIPSATTYLAQESLTREDISEMIDPNAAYKYLISLTEDPAASLQLLDEARELAENTDASTAPWDLLELERHFLDGNIDQALRVIQHIRDEHIEEPGIAASLYRILQEAGVEIPPSTPMFAGQNPNGPPNGPASGPSNKAPQTNPIWTPDSDSASAEEKPTKIWTP